MRLLSYRFCRLCLSSFPAVELSPEHPCIENYRGSEPASRQVHEIVVNCWNGRIGAKAVAVLKSHPRIWGHTKRKGEETIGAGLRIFL